jgi:copper chaperone
MQTETLKVAGMTCEGCTSKVAHALNAITGVHEVVVSLSSGEAAVRYDEHQTTPAQLKSAVKGAGYGVDLTTASHAQQSKGGCCG